MNPQVEVEWKDMEARIAAELVGCSDVTCKIAGWKPVGLAEGLHWVRANIHEGELPHRTRQSFSNAVAEVLGVWRGRASMAARIWSEINHEFNANA